MAPGATATWTSLLPEARTKKMSIFVIQDSTLQRHFHQPRRCAPSLMEQNRGLAHTFDTLFSQLEDSRDTSTAREGESPGPTEVGTGTAASGGSEADHEIDFFEFGTLDGPSYAERGPVHVAADPLDDDRSPELHRVVGNWDEGPDGPPSPLDLATEAFVAGDASRAREVEDLAGEYLQRRELDPVARAVVAIVLSSADREEPSMYEVAEALMTAPVLARIVSHMGRSRVEEAQAQYFSVCRSIGADIARAIRDDLAENTDRRARWIFCQALAHMGQAGREMVEEMVLDDNRFLVRNAVTILGEQGGDRAVELCTSALANPDAMVRKEALRSLTRLGDPESGPIVVGLLDDPDPEVRTAAAVAAGELRAARALKPLIAALDETKDPDVAVPLIRALGRIADPGAVVSIEKRAVPSMFSKPRRDVRIAAYRALSEIGTPRARRLLNQAIDDRDPGVRAAVREILKLR